MKADKTDWDSYYNAPYKTATFSRKITCARLISTMKQSAEKSFGKTQGFSLAELGGANSCFFEQIMREVQPTTYHLIDNNNVGLQKFNERLGSPENVQLHHQDVLNLDLPIQADLVFSVGLIEHFSEADTARAIEAHFKLAKPGGVVVMTFPTPTFLYKITRALSEILGLWIFHDERPLQFPEVLTESKVHGGLLHGEIIWPIFLTQGLVAFQKNHDH